MYENSFTFGKMLAAYTKPHKFTARSTRTELLGYLIVSWVLATATNWAVIGLGARQEPSPSMSGLHPSD